MHFKSFHCHLISFICNDSYFLQLLIENLAYFYLSYLFHRTVWWNNASLVY